MTIKLTDEVRLFNTLHWFKFEVETGMNMSRHYSLFAMLKKHFPDMPRSSKRKAFDWLTAEGYYS